MKVPVEELREACWESARSPTRRASDRLAVVDASLRVGGMQEAQQQEAAVAIRLLAAWASMPGSRLRVRS